MSMQQFHSQLSLAGQKPAQYRGWFVQLTQATRAQIAAYKKIGFDWATWPTEAA